MSLNRVLVRFAFILLLVIRVGADCSIAFDKERTMARGMRISLHMLGGAGTAIVAWIALGTCLSVAQTSTATILGTVKDTTGALIPGASITVKHTETGLTRSVVSGERGGYNVPLLPVGAYEITTTMPGFKQEVRTGINLVV